MSQQTIYLHGSQLRELIEKEQDKEPRVSRESFNDLFRQGIYASYQSIEHSKEGVPLELISYVRTTSKNSIMSKNLLSEGFLLKYDSIESSQCPLPITPLGDIILIMLKRVVEDVFKIDSFEHEFLQHFITNTQPFPNGAIILKDKIVIVSGVILNSDNDIMSRDVLRGGMSELNIEFIKSQIKPEDLPYKDMFEKILFTTKGENAHGQL